MKCQTARLVTKMRINLGALIVLSVLFSCAESTRENIVDPVSAPFVEMTADPAVSAGAVVIAWRYLSEAPLSEFRISRIVAETPTSIGTVTAGSAQDWRTLSFRDTSIIASADVRYRVTSVLGSGETSTSATSSVFRIAGTSFEDPFPDLDTFSIQLAWGSPPEGAIGFRLVRSSDAEPNLIVFETDNPSVRGFSDPTRLGNTRFAYTLFTLLDGGGHIQAETKEAILIRHLATLTRDTAHGQDDKIVTLHSAQVFVAKGDEVYYDNRGSGSDFSGGILGQSRLVGVSLNTQTLSAIESLNLSSPSGAFYLGAYDAPGTQIVFLEVHTSDNNEMVLLRSASWLAPQGSRTGMTPFGGMGTTQLTLYFAGARLFVVDTQPEVLGDLSLPSGEPIDISYQEGAVWLAYPDRLVRSNTAQILDEIVSWEDVILTDDVAITAIHRLEDKFVVLDGTHGEIHIVDTQGRSLLTWPAMGTGIERGDISVTGPRAGENRDFVGVQQTDGAGKQYTFEWVRAE
jgi:hypothetical protein